MAEGDEVPAMGDSATPPEFDCGEDDEMSDEWWQARLSHPHVQARLAELIREGLESGDGVEATDEGWDRLISEFRERAARRGIATTLPSNPDQIPPL